MFYLLGSNFGFKSDLAINKALFSVLILLYPLVDLLRVFIIRIKNGNSPFKPDQNHIHHFLINKEYSQIKYLFIIEIIFTIISIT